MLIAMVDELIQIAVTTNIHNISEMKPKLDAKRKELVDIFSNSTTKQGGL